MQEVRRSHFAKSRPFGCSVIIFECLITYRQRTIGTESAGGCHVHPDSTTFRRSTRVAEVAAIVRRAVSITEPISI